MFLWKVFFRPKILLYPKITPFFHNNIFAFLHQFLCAPKIVRFLHQFFFTPIFLHFYTNFCLHQKFYFFYINFFSHQIFLSFLHQNFFFFYSKFRNLKNDFLEKIGVKKAKNWYKKFGVKQGRPLYLYRNWDRPVCNLLGPWKIPWNTLAECAPSGAPFGPTTFVKCDSRSYVKRQNVLGN